MKPHVRACVVAFLIASIVFPAFAESNAEATLKAIRELRADRKSAQAAEKAKAAVKEVDPASLDLIDAAAWCEIYATALDYKGLRTVAVRWQAQGKNGENFHAQTYLVRADVGLKDMKHLAQVFTEAKPANADESIRLATMANAYIPNAFAAGDKESAMTMLARGEALVPKDGLTDERQKTAAKQAAFRLAKTRQTIEENPGKEWPAFEKERKAAMLSLFNRNRAQTNSAAARPSESRDVKFAKFIGTDAAEIKADKVLGEFKSLTALKGKVVVLDFFAHWCGPCKRGLPSLRALYDDLKPAGLEVVGVTRFYGYYGKENRTLKDMTPADEYERMKAFLVEQNMNWPVAFVGRETFEAYGASAIPHVVVIDRAGKLHKIKVGFNEKEVEAFHKEIEKLLKS